MRSLGLLTYMIPVGFDTACGVLLGVSIGEGSAEKLRFYYRISLYCALASALIQNFLLFAFADPILSLFTDR